MKLSELIAEIIRYRALGARRIDRIVAPKSMVDEWRAGMRQDAFGRKWFRKGVPITVMGIEVIEVKDDVRVGFVSFVNDSIYGRPGSRTDTRSPGRPPA